MDDAFRPNNNPYNIILEPEAPGDALPCWYLYDAFRPNNPCITSEPGEPWYPDMSTEFINVSDDIQ